MARRLRASTVPLWPALEVADSPCDECVSDGCPVYCRTLVPGKVLVVDWVGLTGPIPAVATVTRTQADLYLLTLCVCVCVHVCVL